MADDKILQRKLQKFSDEIMELAKAECAAIEQATESDLSKQRAGLQDSAEQEAGRFLEGEIRSIDSAARTAAFAEKDRLRKELFAIREKYRDNVFSQVAERLAAFSSGDGYPDYLKKAAESARQNPYLSGCTVYLREADLAYADALREILGGCAVAADPAIRLGGAIFASADGRVRLDLTLDQALEEQKQWFASHSGLDITL